MGVYTYVDKTLGLYLTPRLKEILTAVQKDEPIEKKDILYLIDEAARYSTLGKRIKTETYKVKGLDTDQYEIRELLGELFTEMDYLEARNLGQDGTYRMPLPQFAYYSDWAIEKISYRQIETEVSQALRMVKEAQEAFDANEDNLLVIGHFKYLKKHYDIEDQVTVDTNFDELMNSIMSQVTAHVQKQAKQKQDTLERFAKRS